jgi:hypothetical protein
MREYLFVMVVMTSLYRLRSVALPAIPLIYDLQPGGATGGERTVLAGVDTF